MVIGTNTGSGGNSPKVASPPPPQGIAGSPVPAEKDAPGMRRKVQYEKLPWGIYILEKLNICCFHPAW